MRKSLLARITPVMKPGLASLYPNLDRDYRTKKVIELEWLKNVHMPPTKTLIF
jgi:hypothetical protein